MTSCRTFNKPPHKTRAELVRVLGLQSNSQFFGQFIGYSQISWAILENFIYCALSLLLFALEYYKGYGKQADLSVLQFLSPSLWPSFRWAQCTLYQSCCTLLQDTCASYSFNENSKVLPLLKVNSPCCKALEINLLPWADSRSCVI